MIATTPIGTRTCWISIPFRPFPAGDQLADGIGEQEDLLDAGGHGLDALAGQRQPIAERLGALGRAGEIAAVCFE